ncbi:iron-sulfur cluster assembly scaffold protein [Candidatus Woesearchaeota archaeon]|nr:iron-sulfur cluster assembly scaffold protein [Candidatus Woesearchaeota archaeon]
MIDMYQEELLDHYKNPRNFGALSNPDIEFNDTNPLCGDEVKVTVRISSDKIQDIKFDSRGCAISVAAASKLSEVLKNKSLSEVKKMDNKEVLELLGVSISPIRLKCALLSLRALQKGIYKMNGKILEE